MQALIRYYVYIIRCSDNSLYTGISRNVAKRLYQHNYSRYGAKSVKGKLPVKLVYIEIYKTKTEALRREKEIKGWRKEKKELLIKKMRLR